MSLPHRRERPRGNPGVSFLEEFRCGGGHEGNELWRNWWWTWWTACFARNGSCRWFDTPARGLRVNTVVLLDACYRTMAIKPYRTCCVQHLAFIIFICSFQKDRGLWPPFFFSGPAQRGRRRFIPGKRLLVLLAYKRTARLALCVISHARFRKTGNMRQAMDGGVL